MSASQEIGRFLSSRCGFEVPDSRTLRKAVAQRLAAIGEPDEEAYSKYLHGHPAELAELVNLVVVPETFFFRYSSSYRALADWTAKRATRPLRVLSLACSTGEEPYSVAMTLLDAGLAPADFIIEARDISTAAIAAARAGLYGSKSFREVQGDWLTRYFQPEGERHRILPSLARLVTFRIENLLALEEVALWDVIFCRNSLIYFAPPEQRKIAEHISRALVPDGIIFVGPAEPPLFIDSGWMPAGYGMSFSCVRRAVRPSPPARSAGLARPPRKAQPLRKPATRPKPAPVPREPAAPLSLDDARTLADAGRLEEALALLSAALQQEPANAEAHFLQGVVEEARGHLDSAESNYRKALYLQPGHTEALQHMALLAGQQGRRSAATQFHRRATRHAAS